MKKRIICLPLALLTLTLYGCGCSNENVITSEEVSTSSFNTTLNNTTSSQTSSQVTTSNQQTTLPPTSQATSAQIIDFQNELFISEFWNNNYNRDINPNRGNSDHALELYNPSNATIDLSKYTIKIYSNGETTPKNDSYIINLEGSLSPKKAFTLVNNYSKEDLLPYGDISNKPVYIGPKSAVGLYKEDILIDVFGTIGASYLYNDDVVINGVSKATDTHNVIRKNNARASTKFIEEDWEVHSDYDMSSLGVHEDDLLTRPQELDNLNNYNQNAINALNELIDTYYNYEKTTYNGNISLKKKYKDFDFIYDFSACSFYFNDDGTLKKEPSDKYNLIFYISVLDKEGKIIRTSYYAGGTYRTIEGMQEEEHRPYKNALQDLLINHYESAQYHLNGDFIKVETYAYEGTTYKFKYNFFYCSKYLNDDGTLKEVPADGTKFVVEVSIIDNNNESIIIDTQDINCTFEL